MLQEKIRPMIVDGAGWTLSAKEIQRAFYSRRIGYGSAADITAKFDVMEHAWSYQDDTSFKADAKGRTYAFSIGRDFGRYVSLRAYLASVNYEWSVTEPGASTNLNPSKTFLGGEFEFIF